MDYSLIPGTHFIVGTGDFSHRRYEGLTYALTQRLQKEKREYTSF